MGKNTTTTIQYNAFSSLLMVSKGHHIWRKNLKRAFNFKPSLNFKFNGGTYSRLAYILADLHFLKGGYL